MQIGAIGFQPYIYNTNAVSSASLNKISAIPNDATAAKTDFSGLVSGETTNPLKRGESSNFMDILAQQLAQRQSTQSRITSVDEQSAQSGIASLEEQTGQSGITSSDEPATQATDAAIEDMGVEAGADMVSDYLASAEIENDNYASGNQQNLYRMNKALEAYSSM